MTIHVSDWGRDLISLVIFKRYKGIENLTNEVEEHIYLPQERLTYAVENGTHRGALDLEQHVHGFVRWGPLGTITGPNPNQP